MKTKKSAMACWAIGLLIFQMSSTAISYLAYYDFVYFISLLFECIPTIGGIVLIFYDHKYNSPIVGNFTLLRIWSIVLIWVQPVISFLSWASAGLTGSVIATWIGSCIFIIIATVLLVKDGKDFVKKRTQADSTPESQTNNEIEKQEYHTVTFYRAKNSGATTSYSKLADIKILHGSLIENQAPNVPLFPITWYTSQAENIKWDLYSDEVKTDMELYGRW